MDGLSYQAYATIIRSHLELGTVLNDDITRNGLARLHDIYGSSLRGRKIETDENPGTYKTNDGHLRDSEVLVSYLWYPWALDLAQRLMTLDMLAADDLDIGRVNRRKNRRTLGFLAVDLREEALHWSRNIGMFAVAELHMAASGCRRQNSRRGS